MVHRAITAVMIEDEGKKLKSIVQKLEEEQDGWNEEIFEDGVIAMLRSQFSDIVFDAEHDFGFDLNHSCDSHREYVLCKRENPH